MPDPSAELPPPTLRLGLDHHALAENWRLLDRLSGSAEAGAAVKANAYGLGVTSVVPTLLEAGARSFFVAHWSEVPAVIKHAAPETVSVLHGPLNEADAAFARTTGVKPVLNSLHQVRLWLNTGGGLCDVMIDSGINRLGLSLSEIGDPALHNLEIDVLMSHLASADENSDLNAVQLQRFRQAAQQIPARRLSLANSAGIALGPEYAFGLTRPGLALYGGVPRPELAGRIAPVAKPEAAILQRRQLNPGDTVGYNAVFTATRKMDVGVVSLGYADGFLRCWTGKGALASGGARLPLLGKVSMDMVVIDISAAPHLREGDWVEIPFDLPEASRTSGLSQYELLTTLGPRYRR
ncbi:alanine racemase [Allopontixanthobacter sp.]|uniref:alanine racemase n=1 Tax=Allopontixanthobacter sp. TaxID=2906452 RepID=UPI002AB80791|nr:alanine racemase [Allopontixanthobacter sp.]MDZ4307262.1 alanine racemase [Allopontixanthobacter sp.]